jgi:hypothetical protein
MNRRNSMMRPAILLISFALAAATAQAQGMFRSTMPDGRIIYGDKPAPGAKESKEVILQPNIAEPPKLTAPAPSAPQKDFDKADADVKKAQEDLDRARAARAAGVEPQEGERTGIAKSGASRLNDEYDKRIKSLDDAVAAAQARLDDALARRNAAR